MLRLDSISLTQFKNYSAQSFSFPQRITGICGKNGRGKTNLLDAIHYLCFTKSCFTRDSLNSQEGKSGFRIEGHFKLAEKDEKALCILRETGKKEFSVNDELYERFSHHIGHYPGVMIGPDDSRLITGGSEERRRFLDELISQLDPIYLQNLINYNKILVQRNSQLRHLAMTGSEDQSLLEVLDEQLSQPGTAIATKRKAFLLPFLALAKKLYEDIAKQPEDVNLYYESELLQSDMKELLKASRSKDLLMQRSTAGIHRDDLEIELSGQLFRNRGSQGQRKSILLALKLAELETLKNEKGFAPLLMLDDVFEKLDEDRVANLLRKVCVENEGQVFITDTNEQQSLHAIRPGSPLNPPCL